jgi:hypothetical protein
MASITLNADGTVSDVNFDGETISYIQGDGVMTTCWRVRNSAERRPAKLPHGKPMGRPFTAYQSARCGPLRGSHGVCGPVTDWPASREERTTIR